MKQPPIIIVQLIHIHGPMKGKIQEFSEGQVAIGRHPSCHLRFPADLTSVSRKHADIQREGNQFKLTDHSTNGTYVNGKRIEEVYLKSGDVIEFSEGGPKVSFLTEMKEIPDSQEEIMPPQPAPPPEEPIIQPEPPIGEEPLFYEPAVEPPEEVAVQKSSAPLIIQYGPTLRTFKDLPVTIGKNRKCEFVLDHPVVYEQHAQIFFSRNEYWIKDLTGQRLVLINRQPIGSQAPLAQDDEVAMSPKGPIFRYLGGGRLAELSEPPQEGSTRSGEKEPPGRESDENKQSKGLLSKYKKYRDD